MFKLQVMYQKYPKMLKNFLSPFYVRKSHPSGAALCAMEWDHPFHAGVERGTIDTQEIAQPKIRV